MRYRENNITGKTGGPKERQRPLRLIINRLIGVGQEANNIIEQIDRYK